MNEKFRGVIRYSKVLFTPLALLCMVYFVWESREMLLRLILDASILPLCIAIALWVTLHFLGPLNSVFLLRACGTKIRYAHVFNSYAARLPARYIPGGIWHNVGRVMDFSDMGVRTVPLAALMIMENLIAPSVAFILGGIVAWMYRGLHGWGDAAVVFAILGAAGLVILPVVVKQRILKDPTALFSIPYVQAALGAFIYWGLAATSFVAYLKAFPGILSGVSPVEAGGMYLFSWGLGFIAIFAPQGIGVFEAVMGDLLQAPLGLGGTAGLIFGFRMIVFSADILAWYCGRINMPEKLTFASGKV